MTAKLRVIYEYEPTPDSERRLERLAELLLGVSSRKPLNTPKNPMFKGIENHNSCA